MQKKPFSGIFAATVVFIALGTLPGLSQTVGTPAGETPPPGAQFRIKVEVPNQTPRTFFSETASVEKPAAYFQIDRQTTIYITAYGTVITETCLKDQ